LISLRPPAQPGVVISQAPSSSSAAGSPAPRNSPWATASVVASSATTTTTTPMVHSQSTSSSPAVWSSRFQSACRSNRLLHWELGCRRWDWRFVTRLDFRCRCRALRLPRHRTYHGFLSTVCMFFNGEPRIWQWTFPLVFSVYLIR
jgi:hypothetical protein